MPQECGSSQLSSSQPRLLPTHYLNNLKPKQPPQKTILTPLKKPNNKKQTQTKQDEKQ